MMWTCGGGEELQLALSVQEKSPSGETPVPVVDVTPRECGRVLPPNVFRKKSILLGAAHISPGKIMKCSLFFKAGLCVFFLCTSCTYWY